MSEPFLTEQGHWDDVAALVREAGDYVEPSPQLRPRVIDGVRSVARSRQHMYRLACLMVGVFAVTTMTTIFSSRLESLAPPRGVTSEQLHRMAGDRAATAGVEFDWALSEVVTHWRSRMAASVETRGALLRSSAEEPRNR